MVPMDGQTKGGGEEEDNHEEAENLSDGGDKDRLTGSIGSEKKCWKRIHYHLKLGIKLWELEKEGEENLMEEKRDVK